MDQDQLRALLEQVRTGAVDIDAAMGRLRHMPFEDLGFAKVDHHRALRHGMPEVIFAKGKTPEQVVAIAERLLAYAQNVLITRADRECAALVTAQLPEAEYLTAFRRHPLLARPHRARQGTDRRGLRRHQRYPGGGGSPGHRRTDGQ